LTLASYKGQDGLSGPASNLLASMGLGGVNFANLHSDDEDEDDDEEEEAEEGGK
jgi:hypothetical protein